VGAGRAQDGLDEEDPGCCVAGAEPGADREVCNRRAAERGLPDRADPQVGASAQEIGRTQPGRSESGTRNPQTSQTGYSKALPSAQAVRYRTTVTERRKPSIPIEPTVTGTASTKRSGCSRWISIPKRKRPQSSVAAIE